MDNSNEKVFTEKVFMTAPDCPECGGKIEWEKSSLEDCFIMTRGRCEACQAVVYATTDFRYEKTCWENDEGGRVEEKLEDTYACPVCGGEIIGWFGCYKGLRYRVQNADLFGFKEVYPAGYEGFGHTLKMDGSRIPDLDGGGSWGPRLPVPGEKWVYNGTCSECGQEIEEWHVFEENVLQVESDQRNRSSPD